MKPMRSLPPPLPPSRREHAAPPLRAPSFASAAPPPRSLVRPRITRETAPPVRVQDAGGAAELTPELLAALRAIAPRRSRSRFAYVVTLGLAVLAGMALGHPEIRGRLADAALPLLSSLR